MDFSWTAYFIFILGEPRLCNCAASALATLHAATTGAVPVATAMVLVMQVAAALNGNICKETVIYHSDTVAIDAKDWQKWEMKGDTLIFYGFEKVEMANGKDMTQESNGDGKFIEKSVRAKR